ncbi:MAG: DedA family protein [Candidatus Omnitrophica bacterium]|nr:DedA family protein [Candidatus Omnitrophota bacterium]
MVDFFFHIDKYLSIIIQNFGAGSYLLLFAIIFAETGLVVTPFLPGDSLLFAAGAFAAIGSFDLAWLFIVLSSAAIIGDSVNYAIGKFFGEKLFRNPKSKIFKREYLNRTHAFYEKYGGKTIVIARFVPVIRTFAPFVAGIGKMSYLRFFLYNVFGGLLWVASFLLCGFYFGNTPLIQDNFSVTIFVIIFLSILPGIIEFYRHHRRKRLAK